MGYIVNELVYKAKKGDLDAQQHLYEECKKVSLPLCLQNISKINQIRFNFYDLRDLLAPSFLRALRTFDPEKGEFFDYFKYIYIFEIKSLIRSQINYYSHNIQFQNDENNVKSTDQIFTLHSVDYYKDDNKYSDYDLEKIRQLVEINPMKLTPKERKYLTMFLHGLNMKEIAEKEGKNYTETVRSIKRGIIKIRNFCSDND